MGKDCDGFQPFSFQKVTIKKTDESCLITEPLWQCQASSQNLEKPDDKTKRKQTLFILRYTFTVQIKSLMTLSFST